MTDDQRGKGPNSGAEGSDETRLQKEARVGGNLIAGAVLAIELGGKLAGAALRWFMSKPVQPPALAGEPEERASRVQGSEKGDLPRCHPDNPGRLDDRNITLEREHNLFSRTRWGTFFVLVSFAVSVGGGFGFMFIYWTGGSSELLGANLAAFFAGLGVTLVWWAHHLTVHKEAKEPREPLGSPPHERESAASQFEFGVNEIHRRRLLRWMSAIGVGFMASFAVSLLRSFGFDPYTALYSKVWKPGQRLVTEDGKPISINAMSPGSNVIVFPENSTGSERSQTVLIRVHPWMLRLPADRTDWAVQGYVAYSRICTHAGCSVGMYESTAHLLMCPCHQSTFDVLDAGQPTGGPAARALAQLPLYADKDGYLCAAGGFSQSPGPGFWGLQE